MSSLSQRIGRAALLSIGLCFWLPAGPVAAQPSQEQQNAIRSNCRSDYMANCSSVRPGGREALQCLQRNVAKLSPACQSAVNAVTPPSPPQTTAAPVAAPTPPPAAPPVAASPAPAAPAPTAAAPPSTPASPPATSPARPARATPAAAPASSPRPKPPQQRAAAPPAAPEPASTPAPQTAMPAPMPPLRPRVQIQIARACRADQDAVCSMVRPGGGRIIECLVKNEAALSPGCKQALANARR